MKRVSEVFGIADPDAVDAGSMAAGLEAAQAAHDAALQAAGLPPSSRSAAGPGAGTLRAGQPAQR